MARRPGGSARGPAVRPRYGRITSALSSALVTVVALLGAAGLMGAGAPAASQAGPAPATMVLSQYAGSPHDPGMATPRERAAALRASLGAPLHIPGGQGRSSGEGRGGGDGIGVQPGSDPAGGPASDPATGQGVSDVLPADSGAGRRVVFSMSTQRVWLVGGGDRVQRSYLVSGSLTDNLRPGTYEVYSRSRHAVGIDDSGTMQYMVRFAHGKRAAIGFHDIPVNEGRPVQTWAELGTPQSHGCVRQARPDARALWDFAPEGTTVVVTA